MKKYFPTGNQYLALPTVRESDGAIENINVVLASLDGLLDIEGHDGKPFLSLDSMVGEKDRWQWDCRQHWIPAFSHRNDPARKGLILTPPDQRFFLYRGPESDKGATFRVNIGHLFQTINVRHELPHWTCRVQYFSWSWTQGIVIDIFAGSLLCTLALRSLDGARYSMRANGMEAELKDGGKAVETSGPFEICIQCAGRADLLLGAGMSRVGARSADLEVDRLSAETWLERTEQWLSERSISIPDDPLLETQANRNGHFARFYAMAKTLDTSASVSMTSRSHRYYVSAAYWDRDSLLWLYPFLLRNDRKHAEELLRYAFGPQLLHAGIHSRQIGGQILEYGFELDELMAPLIALGQWHALYPEFPLWESEPFTSGLRELLGRLRQWRSENDALYRTELMPTDDLIVGGRDVLTYNNTLVAHGLKLLIPILETVAPELVKWSRNEIAEIPSAIRRHLVRDGKYMWSTDMAGNCEMYDEAAGSLLLLSHYGLCKPDDATYRRTVDHLYSAEYPYRLKGPFSELGNRHTGDNPHPWVLSACNSVLSGIRREQGLDFLRRAPMDNNIACESVNVQTGLPESGFHFATCAGFVAYAIATGMDAWEARPDEIRHGHQLINT